MSTLQKELNSAEIDNVFVYVGDAVRWDFLHRDVAELGTSLKTVASSTHSPSSFATLVSGLPVSEHGVLTFRDSLDPNTDTLINNKDMSNHFLNSIYEYSSKKNKQISDPIFRVLGVDDESKHQKVDECFNQSPFLIVERGPGGHAPYGDYYGTAPEYLREDRSIDEIRRDYRRSIELDVELFKKRLAILEEKDLLEKTLVIYTSDHGELLGEGGMVGHNSPMRPELVYVPSVFIHPMISTNVRSQRLFRHVDMVPTIRDCFSGTQVGKTVPLAGKSLLSEQEPAWGITRYQNSFTQSRYVPGTLNYAGVWQKEGGYTFAKSSLIDRVSVLLGKIAKSPKRKFVAKHFKDHVISYVKGDTVYGNPDMTEHEATRALEDAYEGLSESRADLPDEEKEALEALGYL